MNYAYFNMEFRAFNFKTLFAEQTSKHKQKTHKQQQQQKTKTAPVSWNISFHTAKIVDPS